MQQTFLSPWLVIYRKLCSRPVLNTRDRIISALVLNVCFEAGNLVAHIQMATAMHKQFAWEETRDAGVVSMSTGDGDDARPRKRRKLAQTPSSNHSNGVNGINHEPAMNLQNGPAKDKKRPSLAPFQPLNRKPADDPPSLLEKSRRELPIFSGKQAILDAFQANDTIVILGEPGSGKTTRSSLTLAKRDSLLKTPYPCRSTPVFVGIISYSQQPKNRHYTTTANLCDIHRSTGRRRAVLRSWNNSWLLCTLR